MDDDAVFKNSVSEMIKFWNSVDTNTAGVGFNVINQKPITTVGLKVLLVLVFLIQEKYSSAEGTRKYPMSYKI